MGCRTGVPPGQPHISTTMAAVTSRAPPPSPRTNAREPVTVDHPVDQASSPSQNANTIVRGGEGPWASTRASSMTTPTPPPSS